MELKQPLLETEDHFNFKNLFNFLNAVFGCRTAYEKPKKDDLSTLFQYFHVYFVADLQAEYTSVSRYRAKQSSHT